MNKIFEFLFGHNCKEYAIKLSKCNAWKAWNLYKINIGNRNDVKHEVQIMKCVKCGKKWFEEIYGRR